MWSYQIVYKYLSQVRMFSMYMSLMGFKRLSDTSHSVCGYYLSMESMQNVLIINIDIIMWR